jgi:hypothetical protein
MDVAVMVDRITGRKVCARTQRSQARGWKLNITGPTRHFGCREDRQDDIVTLFLKFEDDLDAIDLIGDAKIYGSSRAEEIHRFGRFRSPFTHVFEVKPIILLLK